MTTRQPADIASLQAAFVASLRQPQAPPPAFVTSHTDAQPLRRFNVYRNNVFASLTAVLGARYPVVGRLVGEEFFAGLARVFVERQPPRSPVMLEYGGGFAEFLETFPPVADLPYLPDVARLEWLQARAQNAADAPSLSGDDLAQVPVERIGDVVFTLHPSVGLLASPFPVFSVWRTNTYDVEVVAIGPEATAEDVLVVRPQFAVEVAKLPPGAMDFLQAVAQGSTLAAANAHAASTTDHFNLQTALAGFIRCGALTAYRLAEPNTG